MRRAVIPVAGVLVAACALFPDLGGLTGSDASAIDAGKDVVEASSDAGGDAAVTCKAEDTFGVPELIAELDNADVNGIARLTHDELTIYFERSPSGDASAAEGGTGGIDLFTASRAKIGDAFGAATALAVNTPRGE